MGVRGVGGLAGFNPVTGAAFGGGADVLAQMIEKGTFNPRDVDYTQSAAEAGVGAIGGTYAKVLMKALGKPLAATVRGGLLGAAMPVARHGIQEGDFNPLNYPGETLMSAGLSGLTGGALAKFLGGKTPPAGPIYQVDATAVPGGQVIGPGGQGVRPTQSPSPSGIRSTGQRIDAAPREPNLTNYTANSEARGVPYVGQPTAPSRSQELLIKADEKARANSEKLTRIENAISEGGLERGAPSVGESISATTPEGATQRMGYRFRAPEEAEEGGDALGTLLRGGPDAPPSAPVDNAAAIEAKIAELQAQMGPVDTTPPFVPGTRFNGWGEGVEEGSRAPWFDFETEPGKWSTTLGEDALRSKGLDVPQYPVDAPPPSTVHGSARLAELTDKEIAGTLTAEELAEARQLMSARSPHMGGTPSPDAPPPKTGEIVEGWRAAGAKNVTPGGPRPEKDWLGKVNNDEFYTHLDDPWTAGLEEEASDYARSVGRGSTQSAPESFADIMAKITQQAKTQSLDDVIGQVPEGSRVRALTPDGMVSNPVGQDAGDAMAALQDDIPSDVPALPAGPEANPDLIQQLRNLRPAQEGLDLLGKEGRYGRLQEAFKTGTGSKEDARGAGKLLRYAAGEVGAPTGKAAAQAGPPLAPSAEAPVAPSWEADEMARWTRLTPEQRAAELAGESTPSPAQVAPEGTGAPGEALSDIEPDWVRQEMAKLEARGAKTNPMEASQGLETPEEAAQVMDDIRAFLDKQNGVEPSMPDAGPASPKSGSKPRLNKRSGERGAVPIGLINSLASGTLGAGVGAAWDPLDDRTESALAGFGVGAAAPHAPSFISKLAKQAGANTDGLDKFFTKTGEMIPQLQRANYLYDPIGLSANTFAGPYGSASMGSLEKVLGGDPRGKEVLKKLNPYSFGKAFPDALEEAKTLPGRMERGESTSAFNDLTNPLDKYAQAPGMTMTGGDVTARNFLTDGGFSPHEAREMTLTSDPFTKTGDWLSKADGFVADMLLPFKRTPVNIAEQGALRTPGLGFLMQSIGNRAGTRPADSLRQQLVQQGMGAGVLVGSEQLGENLSPEQAKMYRRFVTNAAGPYSMLAGAGLAAGQGIRRGQNPVAALGRNITQQLPLPSTDRVTDLWRMFNQVSEGQIPDRPRGVLPTAFEDTLEFLDDHKKQRRAKERTNAREERRRRKTPRSNR